MLESLYGEHGALLHASMKCLEKRTSAINENLSNIDTPSYKRKNVEFESELQRYRRFRDGRDNPYLARTNSGHMGSMSLTRTNGAHLALGPNSLDDVKPAIWRSDATAFRNDGNNVDIDFEMSLLAQTEITYNAVATMMKNKFEGIKGVIRGS